MNFDTWKSTPSDERDVTRAGVRLPIRQCMSCRSVVSPQFVRVGDGEYECQACWRLRDDRRNSVPMEAA